MTGFLSRNLQRLWMQDNLSQFIITMALSSRKQPIRQMENQEKNGHRNVAIDKFQQTLQYKA